MMLSLSLLVAIGTSNAYRMSMQLNSVPRSDKEALVKNIDNAINFASKASLTAASIGAISAIPAVANAKDKIIWEKIDLPVRETLFDIAFDKAKPLHGWVVGAKGTFLETFDGGNTWNSRSFTSLDEDEDINYRFEVASMDADEGWIIGKPALMLHTRDGGKQFERIPLSPKLPGDPTSIISTGPAKAEMITSQGAVYQSSNGGLNWKAQVKETIDATLNRVSSSGTSGASYFNGKIANQVPPPTLLDMLPFKCVS
jgi:photosystem II stability/assembly factor-like uncharacterized protein